MILNKLLAVIVVVAVFLGVGEIARGQQEIAPDRFDGSGVEYQINSHPAHNKSGRGASGAKGSRSGQSIAIHRVHRKHSPNKMIAKR